MTWPRSPARRAVPSGPSSASCKSSARSWVAASMKMFEAPDAPPATLDRHWLEIDAYVAGYEAALAGTSAADLGSFLPDRAHPLFLAVLRELVRVDMEFAWERGA